MPPETLANLLDCLVNKDSKDIKQLKKQSDAIIKILHWISGNELKIITEVSQRQFELTMMNLVGNLESMYNPKVKWQSFYKGVNKIIDFFRYYKDSIAGNKSATIKFNMDKLAINMALKNLCDRYIKKKYTSNYGGSFVLVYKKESSSDTIQDINMRKEIKELTEKGDRLGSWNEEEWGIYEK